jgi:dihydropteroate synthase
MLFWQTSRRKISLNKTLVMGIINVTPDSFSNGGEFPSVNGALVQADKFIADGADILDIGGESTRPNSAQISLHEELERVVPVIEAITKRFDVPISVDTTKAEVAESALAAGAEIINDISGLRFDERIAEIATKHHAGLVLMHSRGSFETMHSQPPVKDILAEVTADFRRAIETTQNKGIDPGQIVLDVGIGFSKTFAQNLELLAKLGKLVEEFPEFPILVGTSRKSFIGKILGDTPPDKRLSGSLATGAVAVWNGAKIVRVHDVKEMVEVVRVVEAIIEQK